MRARSQELRAEQGEGRDVALRLPAGHQGARKIGGVGDDDGMLGLAHGNVSKQQGAAMLDPQRFRLLSAAMASSLTVL